MFHSDSALVYARELRAHGYGEPLWQPEPSQYGEVLIGDVGFIADGRFYRLFNATSAADDRVNAEFGVPDGFVPLQYNKRVHLQTNENYLPPGPICSKSMVLAKVDGNARGKGILQSYKFKLASEAGAVLIPGSDVTLSHVQATPSFRNYVLSHHASWYNFAVSQQREIDAEDIVLVSGCMKTSEWALAAVTGRGQSRTILFAPQGSDPSAQFGFEQSTDAVVSVTQRSGPKRSDAKTGRGGLSKTPDQCLFMKYYRIKYRRFLREIDAASQPGYSGAPVGTPQGSTESFSQRSSIQEAEAAKKLQAQKFKDGLDDLLNYILSHSSANIAVACHDDLSFLSIESVDEVAGALEDIRPRVQVDSNGLGYISHHEHVTISNLISPPLSIGTSGYNLSGNSSSADVSYRHHESLANRNSLDVSPHERARAPPTGRQLPTPQSLISEPFPLSVSPQSPRSSLDSSLAPLGANKSPLIPLSFHHLRRGTFPFSTGQPKSAPSLSSLASDTQSHRRSSIPSLSQRSSAAPLFPSPTSPTATRPQASTSQQRPLPYTSTFRRSPNGSVLLIPPEGFADRSPLYRIDVYPSIFTPTAFVTDVYRGDGSTFLGQFEMGGSQEKRLLFMGQQWWAIDTVCMLYRKVPSNLPPDRWTWKRGRISLYWDCRDVSKITCQEGTGPSPEKPVVARFRPAAAQPPETFANGPPESMLDVNTLSQDLLDDIILSCLIVERKRTSPSGSVEKSLFSWLPVG